MTLLLKIILHTNIIKCWGESDEKHRLPHCVLRSFPSDCLSHAMLFSSFCVTKRSSRDTSGPKSGPRITQGCNLSFSPASYTEKENTCKQPLSYLIYIRYIFFQLTELMTIFKRCREKSSLYSISFIFL